MANLDAIVKVLQSERDRLDAAIAALRSLNGNKPTQTTRRRHMSAAARARISAAQKARWAKSKGTATKPKRHSVRKRHISPAGLARIRTAQRARWAKVRAKQKKG